MQDRNEITITGTVYNEPRCSHTKSGVAMAQFTAAVHRPDPSQSSDLINVTAFESSAEKVEEGFHVKDRITVKGRMQRQYFVGKDGQSRNYFRVLANEVERPEEEVQEVQA
jgi:single-stranded DNA-binding protein